MPAASRMRRLMAREVLIVDDEEDIRELISDILRDEGYETRSAKDSDAALLATAKRPPHLLILDIWLQGSRLDGLELLDAIKQEHKDLPVIMISGHGNIETAVAAIKRGAFDFIEKPFKTDHLLHLVSRATELDRLRRENKDLRERAVHDDELIGQSPAITNLKQSLARVAPTNSRVLIAGPAGSGKEVTARNMHKLSARANGPFVVVNAASISPENMEIELFGSEQSPGGAPGGRKIGLFERAHGGTLFLDEVADMPIETQNKILRVLVDQTFERVGGHSRVEVDVRVVSGTSRNLRDEIAKGRFREDLYHRLNVVPLHVPALTERHEDIPLLIAHFMTRIVAATGLATRQIDGEAMAAIQAYQWPGNVRQLRNVVERLLIMAGGDVAGFIRADMLPTEFSAPSPDTLKTANGKSITSVPLREAREAFEREYLRTQINRFGGNISKTATFVGMERSALHRKLKSLGLHGGDRRKNHG